MSDPIQYFIHDGETQKGPFSLGQMRTMWGNCQINLATQYRTADMDTWCPLSDIAELMEPIPARAASQAVVMSMVPASKTRWVYIVLGLFLGCLGIHNFYAKRYVTGFTQLAITLVLGWIVVGLFITGLWALIEIFTVTHDGTGIKME